MAESPAHRFGQIIGEVLEAALIPLLKNFAEQHGLYLDGQGPRPARSGTKVRWRDQFGNSHDLDYVLEKNGTPDEIGIPVGFIETAWRRYTKHSRNKAQEIQGAILPLVSTHRNSAPFIGAILAGEFTDGALCQLRSHGFRVLYFPYRSVVDAFQVVKIDAAFDEDTPDAVLATRVAAWKRLGPTRRGRVAQRLLEIEAEQIRTFFHSLEQAILRRIKTILVIPLHGTPLECPSVDDAISKIANYREAENKMPVVRYEIEIRYNNSDTIVARF